MYRSTHHAVRLQLQDTQDTLELDLVPSVVPKLTTSKYAIGKGAQSLDMELFPRQPSHPPPAVTSDHIPRQPSHPPPAVTSLASRLSPQQPSHPPPPWRLNVFGKGKGKSDSKGKSMSRSRSPGDSKGKGDMQGKNDFPARQITAGTNVTATLLSMTSKERMTLFLKCREPDCCSRSFWAFTDRTCQPLLCCQWCLCIRGF